MSNNTTTRPVLVHTRNEEDAKTLAANFDLTKLGSDVRFTHGLMPSAQASLLACKETGRRIISTGLPLDIASEVGEVTLVRAWNKVREDGSKSSGATPPADYHAGKIVDAEAFAALKQLPEFAAAFGLGPATDAVC